MTVWLLLAGDYAAPNIAPKAEDYVIAVDGGIRHAAHFRRVPDVWLGDFDSSDAALAAQYANVPRLAFPADKTQSDFELALAYANAHARDDTRHILGSSGNEADHAFANLWVLPQSAAPCIVWQKNAVILAAHGAVECQFSAKKGSKISVFAYEALGGVQYHGLRWPAPQTGIEPFVALAARNEMAEEHARIAWQSGFAAVYLPREVKNIKIRKIS